MRGSSTDDSKKSLSPVRKKSAFEDKAALRIGLSFTSLINSSSSITSRGVFTTSITSIAEYKNASNSVMRSGNSPETFYGVHPQHSRMLPVEKEGAMLS